MLSAAPESQPEKPPATNQPPTRQPHLLPPFRSLNVGVLAVVFVVAPAPAAAAAAAPSGPEKEMFRIKCYRKDLRPDFCASHATATPPLSRSPLTPAPLSAHPPTPQHPATCFMIIYELSPLKYKCCVYEHCLCSSTT